MYITTMKTQSVQCWMSIHYEHRIRTMWYQARQTVQSSWCRKSYNKATRDADAPYTNTH